MQGGTGKKSRHKEGENQNNKIKKRNQNDNNAVYKRSKPMRF